MDYNMISIDDYCNNKICTTNLDKLSMLLFFAKCLANYKETNSDTYLISISRFIPNIRAILNSLDPVNEIAAEQLWQYLISNTKN